MRVVIAMDSFKGSLSSIEAGKAVAEGVRRADGAIECAVCPVADGGEGTSAALTEGLHGETVRVRVTGPLGEKVTAEYGVKGDLAILEMAQAAGLPLVPQDKRNPMKTTTYGVGEMLRDAINRGCKRFILGIGGSATNDGGAGMLQALGFDLLDKDGNPVPFGAEGLRVLAKIENKNALPALKNCVRRHKPAVRRKRVQCRLWSAKGCYTRNDSRNGRLYARLRRIDERTVSRKQS